MGMGAGRFAALGAVSILGVLAASPGSAAAAADPLVVEHRGAQAVVELSPFRLSFKDASTGRTVLRQVPGTPVPAPGVRLLPTRAGQQEVMGAQAYQPMGFQVGGEAKVPSAYPNLRVSPEVTCTSSSRAPRVSATICANAVWCP